MGNYNRHIVKITRTYSCHYIFKYQIAENQPHQHRYPHKNPPFAGTFIEYKQKAYGYPDKPSITKGRYKTHYIIHQRRGEIFAYKHQKIVFPDQKITFFLIAKMFGIDFINMHRVFTLYFISGVWSMIDYIIITDIIKIHRFTFFAIPHFHNEIIV